MLPKTFRTTTAGRRTEARCATCTHELLCIEAFKLRDGPIDWWFCDQSCFLLFVEHRHSDEHMHAYMRLSRDERVAMTRDPRIATHILSHMSNDERTVATPGRRTAWLRIVHHCLLPVHEDTVVPPPPLLWVRRSRVAPRRLRKRKLVSSATGLGATSASSSR